MKQEEFVLKVQALLDGELSPAEIAQVESQMRKDPAASALFQELKTTRDWLKTNESVRPCPESHDFTWSKIQRAIAQGEAAARPAVREGSLFQWIRRHFVAAGSLAMASAAVLLVTLQAPRGLASRDDYQISVENQIDGTQVFYYRSDSAKATLVWLANVD